MIISFTLYFIYTFYITCQKPVILNKDYENKLTLYVLKSKHVHCILITRIDTLCSFLYCTTYVDHQHFQITQLGPILKLLKKSESI